MSKPQGLVLITEDGQRIPIDVRLSYTADDGTRYWAPMIEGDLGPIMPSVIAFDGPAVHVGECIHFETPGPGWDTLEWAQRVMANSRHVFSWYTNADGSCIT